MWETSRKVSTQAVAEGEIRMSREAFDLVASQWVKGDGGGGGGRCDGGPSGPGELIPLCHPLGLDVARVEARLEPDLPGCGCARR